MATPSVFRQRDLSPTQGAILDGYFGRGVIVKPAVVRALKGNGNAAILLSQMVYLSLHHGYDDRDGWFYNTREELEEATGLAPDVQTNARRKLTQAGLVEANRKRTGGRLHYRVNLSAVAAVLAEAQPRRDAGNDVTDEKLENPVSRNEESRFLETDNPGFSITKTSAKTSTTNTSSPTSGDTEAEVFETFRAKYNAERGQLTKALVLSSSTERSLRQLVRRAKSVDTALEWFGLALTVVREDPHWLGSKAVKPSRDGRPYGIENLSRHVIDKYNIAAAEQEHDVQLGEGQEWTTSIGLVKVLDVLSDTVVVEVRVAADDTHAVTGTVLDLSPSQLRKLVRA